MADVFPPIHLYAVLAASIGLLAAGKDGARLRTKFPRNLWLCLPALAAGLHLIGYILIDIFNEQSSKLTPGQAWTLQIHAVVLSLFLLFALHEFFRTAQSSGTVEEKGAEERLSEQRGPQQTVQQSRNTNDR